MGRPGVAIGVLAFAAIVVMWACGEDQPLLEEPAPTVVETPVPTDEPTVAPTIAPTAPPTAQPAKAPSQTQNCHPSYTGACLDPNSPDYDCAGGSGNGPDYTGRVNVVGPDEYGLDSDGNGVGCE